MAHPFEKRNHDRMKTSGFTIQYRFLSDEYLTRADVVNISGGGICFLRSAPLLKKDVIEVQFPFRSQQVILKAEVVRVEGREVGIKFIDDPDRIGQFVDLFNREYRIIREDSLTEEEKKKSLFAHRHEKEGPATKDVDDLLRDV